MPNEQGGGSTVGHVSIEMTAKLLVSAGTFRYCTFEKVSFVLLNQVDLILTVLAMSLGFYELNPWMRTLLAMPLQLIVIKCAVPVLIAWLSPGKLLLPAIALLCLVVGWNAKELLIFLL